MTSVPTDRAILADPAWLAHRYDRPGDAIHFRHVPRGLHGDFPFLIEEHIGAMPAAIVAKIDDVVARGGLCQHGAREVGQHDAAGREIQLHVPENAVVQAMRLPLQSEIRAGEFGGAFVVSLPIK